jgi:ABC-type antimicrobial peptide transport system permease subunit
MRFTTVLLASFAFAALVLSIVGIYGLLAYSVSRRQRELAIRKALGASDDRILKLVLTQGLTLALAGVVLGLCGAAAATRVLSSMLYGVSARDFVSFLLAPMLFLVVAAVATYLPARRATRLSAMEAMR